MNQIIPKVWGHEEVLVNNSLYCGKLLYLKRGMCSSLHLHKRKHEHLYVFKGKVKFILMGKEFILSSGMIIEVKPFQEHLFGGLKNSIIIEISTQHFDSDSERFSKSGRMCDILL